MAEKANRDSEGVFIRSDGELVPNEIAEETIDFLWSIHKEADKFSRQAQKFAHQIPKSMGHFFEERFQTWVEEKEPETRLWRKQLFNWFIKFEECDTGCDDFYKHSCISWGEYLDYGEDASFAEGYQSVVKTLLSQLKNTPVLLEHRVTRIDYDHQSAKVFTANGKVFQADHLISTIPLGVLKTFHRQIFNPSLPNDLITAIESISFGTIDRVKLDFEEAFWDLNDPGLLIVQEQETRIETVDRTNWFRHIFTFDEVIYHPTVLMGWLSGEAARFMENLTDEEIAEDVCKYLEGIMRKNKKDPEWKLPTLRQIVVTRWHSNPNFKGVYSYRNQTEDAKGVTNKDLSSPVYVNGCPRILFAGEATDFSHYGTVHGAMSAAQREVERLEAFWKNNQ